MKRLVTLLFALALAGGSAQAQTRAERLRGSLGTPLFHVECSADGEKVAFPSDFTFAPANGEVGKQQKFAAQGKNKWGTGPCKDGVAIAISAAYQYRPTAVRPGTPVVEISGTANGIYVGGIGQPGATGVAFWPGNAPIEVALVGATPSDAILGVNIGDKLGGIARLVLCGLTILGPPGSSSAVTVYQGSNTGRLCIWSCTILGADASAWGGHGTKWPIRAQGHLNGVDGPLAALTDYTGSAVTRAGDGQGGGLEVIDCVIWPGQEHAYLYVDNIGPNSVIDGLCCHPGYDRALWVERTLVQITNRANPAGVTAGGPSGYGSLEIANIESVPCGGEPNGGGNGDGSAITVAGHLGPVSIHDITLRDYHGGGIVVWTDAAQIKGAWRFPDGFTTGELTLAKLDLESDVNTNPSVSIGGARSVSIGEFRIRGRNSAIDIDNRYVGPVATGPVRFVGLGPSVSRYSGWQSAGKLRRKEVALTATEIDALAQSEPSEH